jgi:hypothetical protein
MKASKFSDAQKAFILKQGADGVPVTEICRNDWNSIHDLHQGPRSKAASRGRIHDRSPIRLHKHQKNSCREGAVHT